MSKKELNTVKELLFWSYANLAMAHTAVNKKQEKYTEEFKHDAISQVTN